MVSATHILDTTIGRFVFSIVLEGPGPKDASIDLREVSPPVQVPRGMSVQRCRAVVVRFRSRTAISLVRWSCECRAHVSYSPRTGEGLDAMEWVVGDRIVVVGTEDYAYLAARPPFLSFSGEEGVATISDHKLETDLPNVPADTEMSLHFVVAENLWPEPVESSAWFAVDVSHQSLLKLLE